MFLPARPRRALVASLVGAGLLLCGCGLDASSSADSTADDGPITIGFVNGGSTQFHTCLQQAVSDAAQSNFAKLVTANSRQDADKELANIRDMIKRHVDAIIVQTVNTDALKDDITLANKAKIPIFLTSVSVEPGKILGAVTVDLNEVGKLDAQWVAGDAGGRSVQVGVIAGAPGAASDLLVGGFTKALPSTADVVDNQPGMYDDATAKAVAQKMIAAHPGLNYAFVANEDMAFAARKAFDAAGATGVKIVSVNGTDEGLAALKDGRLSATVSNSANDTGQLAVTNVVGLLRKDKVDKIDKTPIRLVTKGNADTAPLYCPTS